MSDCVRLLICPVCSEPLAPGEPDAPRSLRCPARHSFDYARDGSVDLLPPGHGRSRRTGDSMAMVDARRRFLARGWYAPFADALIARALRHVGSRHHGRRSIVAVDAGCGDGWWIGGLTRTLAAAHPGLAICAFGFDVSPDALRRAARAWPDVRFFRNDVAHRICLASGSADLLLDVFAPRNASEFARVLRPDGLALVVIPHDHHLRELRAELPLLDIDADKRDRTIAALERSLELDAEEEIVSAHILPATDSADLLRMTPNHRHLDDAAIAAITAAGDRTVTFAMRLLAFRRRERAATAPQELP